MRIAVYGGSFNPPHVGHAMVAGWLRWTDRVDEVWFVPCSTHAFQKPLMPWSLRLAMCRALATTLGPWARVDGIEEELGGVSYMVRTLDALAARHPDDTFHLVIGADVLGQTGGWRDWERIAARYPPIVVGRAGFPAVEGSPTFPDVSSTDIRDRIARGSPWQHLVPRAVSDVLLQARQPAD